MRAVDIIRKKRDGAALSRPELSFLVRGYSAGGIPDYQLASFLMAVFFRGMTDAEMADLTTEMKLSGGVLDLSDVPGPRIDKHSTGGVGDKTSLVVAPAVAAAGITVPMISGRALAHTGGTLDKLESIPGFDVRLSPGRFKEALKAVGAALIGQTDDLVPADRKLYALRDVTATVDSRPLIASSIMSKKLAEGVDGLVLDVKTGSGAFMKQPDEAEALARAMVAIGKACGVKVAALITDMNQPLGVLVGNSLEVIECIEVLKGNGPGDLARLCEELSAHCLLLGEAAEDLAGARTLYREMIASGKALRKFRAMIEWQGGDPGVIDDYRRLPQARFREPLLSPSSGFVRAMDTEEMGIAMCILGAGRETVDSAVNHAVGMHVHKKIGDRVEKGEPLCTLFYDDEARRQAAGERLLRSYNISGEPPDPPTLIKKTIS